MADKLEAYQSRNGQWEKLGEGWDGNLPDSGGGSASVDPEEVKQIVADEIDKIQHPKKIYFVDKESDLDKSQMQTDEVAFVGAGPMEILKGADGVCGWMPDYNRVQTLTGKASNGGDWPYGHYVECPDNGWMYALCVTSAGTSTLVGRTSKLQKNETRAGQSASAYCAAVFPVLKGDYAYASSNKALSRSEFYFYPILKPELTDEHVVGYLGDKPVYEKTVVAPLPPANEGILFDFSSLEIDTFVSLTGFAHLSNGVSVVFPVYWATTSNYFRIYRSAQNNIHVQFAGSQYSNGKGIGTVRYTKTTD